MPRGRVHIQPTDLKRRSIGIAVSDLRRRAGISQEQLGAECGFDRTYISRLERGILNPTAIRLWAIADTLKTPFHQLIHQMENWAAEQVSARR